MGGDGDQLTEELQQQYQAAMPAELPVGYYLRNFEFLLDFVSERYATLLTTEEIEFRKRFFSLSDPARKLYVRLVNRKGQLFRLDKLVYDEIPDLGSAMDELVEQCFAQRVIPATEDALTLCNRRELLSHPLVSGFAASARKQDLAEEFLAADVNPLESLDIPVVEQLNEDICAVYRLLFFGNFHQDMTEFVMHELVAPFENYPLDVNASLFAHRSVIDALFELKVLSDLSYEVIETDEEGRLLLELACALPDRPAEPLLARRFDRIVNRVARQLERLDQGEEALKLYRQSQSAPSRERQARLLEKLGDVKASLDLCETIVDRPQNEEELEFAHQFGARHAKKYGHDRPHFCRPEPDLDIETIQVDRVHDRVELSALAYYQAAGNEGYYVENSLLRSLFGLVFWDIIFAPVRGAFFHPFQRGPADLNTPDFVLLRQSLIDERFAELDHGIEPRVTCTLREKFGTANQFVYWGMLDDVLLSRCVNNIPVEHLQLIFRRMLNDLRNNTNGLPDLILFDDSEYRMIEIKGPGDKLQKNQTRWFNFFRREKIPATVVNVEYL